jgi:hypothetical protein
MRRKRKRKRTTTGSSLRTLGSALLIAGMAACLALADKPSRQQAAAEPAALIAVSVFREPGFALPGAELQLSPASGEKPAAKVKKLKAATDARGEFVFRVPPVPMQYKLSVSAKGLKSQDKPVFINAEERVDVTFMLERESK